MEDKSKSYKTARDYIRSSSIFTNERHSWVKGLVSKVLENKYDPIQAKELVTKLLPLSQDGEEPNDVENTQEQSVEEAEDDASPKIAKIESINYVKNIGLLNMTEPVKLEDGLNIFYGKNASGKSSVYVGLTRLLGHGLEIIADVSNPEELSECEVLAQYSDGSSDTLQWQSDGTETFEEGCAKIFDSEISNHIVETDQENTFSISYLEMHYFSLVSECLDMLDEEFDDRLKQIELSADPLEEHLSKEVPEIFEEGYPLSKSLIEETKFPKTDREKLEGLQKKLQTLKDRDLDKEAIKVGNLSGKIESNLNLFAKFDPIKKTWNSRLSLASVTNINELIKEKNRLAKLSKSVRRENFKELIPSDWIDSDLWFKFIESSIDFVESLEQHTKHTYKNSKCPYCQQEIADENSQSLIKAYEGLMQNYQADFDKVNKKLQDSMDYLEKMLTNINANLEPALTLIENSEYFETESLDFDLDEIVKFINSVISGIKESSDIAIEDNPFPKLVDSLVRMYTQSQETVKSLKDTAKNKQETAKKLENEIAPLDLKARIVEHREEIIKYIELSQIRTKANEYIGEVSVVRKSVSSTQSKFEEAETMKEFKKILLEEYKALRFKLPKTWKIKVSSPAGKRIRTYYMGDFKISKIFSEGERKLHALADFFAIARLSGYKGVYIFDDPVNSLDEENIMLIARRIKKLVAEGNQVIVFTHNLVFLNSLISTDKDKITELTKYGDGQIIVEPSVAITSKGTLKKKWGRIDKAVQLLEEKSESEIDSDDISTIYDKMSGYLESYFEIEILKNVISRYRVNLRPYAIEELKNLDSTLIDKFSELYDKTSKYGSRHASPSGVTAYDPTMDDLREDVQNLQTNFKY